jgi:thiosulfate/3-mercaptopyruvate sulfurtransferase
MITASRFLGETSCRVAAAAFSSQFRSRSVLDSDRARVFHGDTTDRRSTLNQEHHMRRQFAFVHLLLLPALALLFALPAAAASAIVDTAYVVQAIQRNAIVWDVRGAPAYQQGHIPGAVNIGDVGVVLRDENREDYLPKPVIESLLGGGGIDPAREVIVYGAKANPYAYFALVTLQYFGGNEPRIYHGGIEDWKAAGQPVSTDVHRLPMVKLSLKPQPGMIVETADVMRMVKQRKVQIVDARTPEEFRGEDIRALRGGHIPGAIPIHYMENWVDPDARQKLDTKLTTGIDGLDLKPREQLRALYGRLDPSKETVVYCQSGIRAAETVTVLKELGFSDVKLYDSSWIGYGNQLDAPVEDLTFFNVGTLQGKLGAMSKRIEVLEHELAATKAAK